MPFSVAGSTGKENVDPRDYQRVANRSLVHRLFCTLPKKVRMPMATATMIAAGMLLDQLITPSASQRHISHVTILVPDPSLISASVDFSVSASMSENRPVRTLTKEWEAANEVYRATGAEM